MERQPSEWERSCVSYISDRGLVSRVHEETYKKKKKENKNEVKKTNDRHVIPRHQRIRTFTREASYCSTWVNKNIHNWTVCG